jgi:hypothetical protein
MICNNLFLWTQYKAPKNPKMSKYKTDGWIHASPVLGNHGNRRALLDYFFGTKISFSFITIAESS